MFEQRKSGLLLPVFSLPGPYGIGTMGREARSFVDFLVKAGQRYWQILPLVPTGFGDSPYMSPSSFAGNPLLLDLDWFRTQGLLSDAELASARQDDLDRVHYDAVRGNRTLLFQLAWQRAQVCGLFGDAPSLPHQVEEYITFAAGQDGLPEDYHRFLQTAFFTQWAELKSYANARGVLIIGDLPFYVSPQGAEVSAQPDLFQLAADGTPAAVAGVPPDAFSDQGQRWGNPLYDWAGRSPQLFEWWSARMAWAHTLYDVVRIDHFRGIHTYWSIPADAQSAKAGHWVRGPGMALIRHLENTVPNLCVIAEDLGDLDAEALDFIRNSGLPGMNVLVYAFDPVGESAYLPHNALPCSVAYTGTHDTPTFVQWLFDQATAEERAFCSAYLRLSGDEGFGWGAVRGAWASPARLAIAPMADVLGLGADARINTPGTVGPHNWSWRIRSAALNDGVASSLRRITRTYRRV